jgi:RNA polymerase sigma factor (TIGR02999 family)
MDRGHESFSGQASVGLRRFGYIRCMTEDHVQYRDHSGESDEITLLLKACSIGEPDAFDRLMPLVYDDLRAIAHRRLRLERAGHTLGTTAVVHEAYVKLVDQASATWRDRAHFYAVSARVIRNLLIDYARERKAAKRGGGAILLPLDEQLAGEPPRTIELLALDEALTDLGRRDGRLERLIECRFFGGMTMQETAETMGVSLSTAERDWRRARAYLFDALR